MNQEEMDKVNRYNSAMILAVKRAFENDVPCEVFLSNCRSAYKIFPLNSSRKMSFESVKADKKLFDTESQKNDEKMV